MIKIGDFARLAQVSIRLLRHYDEIGLLRPVYVDHSTGYRYYSLDQMSHLHRILALKDLGLSLEQIIDLMSEAITSEQIRGILLLKRAELRQYIETEQLRLARVEARLRHLDETPELPAVEVVLKSVRPEHVISLRRALPLPQSPAALFQQARPFLREMGLGPHIESVLCIYHTRYILLQHPGIKPRRKLIEAANSPPACLHPCRTGTRRQHDSHRFRHDASSSDSGNVSMD
jgi:DNA-binding transcriptional MerR regulator